MCGADARTPLATGGCQCGAVRYAIYGEPTKAGLCHCRMCQRAVGGPSFAFTGVEKSDFAWTDAPPTVFRSSSESERGFCSKCGTPMTYDYLPGSRITLAIATLDDPAIAEPARNIGIESKLSWVDHIGDWQAKTSVENAGTDYVENVVSRQSTRD